MALEGVNWLGLWSHTKRGLMRFMRYAALSVFGPAVSSLLFLAVFVVALDEPEGGGISFAQFVTPGIALFTAIHSAFQNAAAAIIEDKHEGIIADILMAPLRPLEQMIGYTVAAAISGLVTGATAFALMSFFVSLPVFSVLIGLGFTLIAVILFALLGTLVGLWADKWEHFSAAETFLMLPLGVLSGAFFRLDSLPESGQILLYFNPLFYAVEGLRYSLFLESAAPPVLAAGLLTTLALAFAILAWRLFVGGYKIKP